MIKIGFIGFGLIGGSLARIWSRNHSDHIIIAYNYHDKPSDDLLAAKEDGVISAITSDLSDIAECRLIVLAAPVIVNIAYLKKLAGLVNSDTIITDVGSVKGMIVSEAEKLGLSRSFIGGHPMAGSEKTGYKAGSVHLFENAYYLLTPTEQTPEDKLDFLTDLVKETNAETVILSPERHDAITAAISHLPHLIAASLVNTVADEDDERGQLAAFAAGGFRDITRIASSSPLMWRDICLSNPDAISAVLTKYISTLTDVLRAVKEKDGESIVELFTKSREYRGSLPLRKASDSVVNHILLYIPDEPGSILTISAILAAKGLSIKNIGIAHNREYSDGVLEVEFYDSESAETAKTALKERNYRIFE